LSFTAAGVGDRDLHVDVLAPGGEAERLAAHLGKLVREHLQREGLGGHGAEDVAGKGLVVLDPGLAHQARVGRQAPDVGLGVKVQDARPVGAIGVQLDREFWEGLHRRIRD